MKAAYKMYISLNKIFREKLNVQFKNSLYMYCSKLYT